MNCTGCNTPLRPASGDGRCGFCRAEALETTVAALGEGPPSSTLAVWSLLERGVDQRAVTLAVRAVKSGTPIDEVAAGIDRILDVGSAA